MIKIVNANGKDEIAFIERLKERAEETDIKVEETVRAILRDVKMNGDRALLSYHLKFDKSSRIKIYKRKDFQKAYNGIPNDLKLALDEAARRITAFHKKQIRDGYETTYGQSSLGQIVRALERVAVYVPGGTAAYPSSVLMSAIPARLAGVKEIIMLSPPKDGKVNPNILAAAYVAGVDELILIGGAHGIAALAYGTETIKKADKIVGPGNIYVATAKRLIYGACDIDMVAGPSEITVVADSAANPDYVAADMISQAEHDRLASSLLITTSRALAEKVDEKLAQQAEKLPRKEIIMESLTKNGGAIVCRSKKYIADLVNRIAPEHLEILTSNPRSMLPLIKNAGSVFLGSYSPEPLGDYLAGTNHVLPTGGTARFFSPLSVDSFIKKMQYIEFTKADFSRSAADIVTLAESEGLDGHANSVKVRLKK